MELLPEGGLFIHPEVTVTPGMDVRPAGSMVKCGDLLAKKHQTLRALDLACLAMGGVTQIEVYKKPRVAFLPTGSELVPLGAPVGRGNIIDSNSLLARHLLLEMGAEPVCMPIVKDDPKAIFAALEQALQTADIVLLNGGSSKGDEDFNARLLAEKGSVLFHGIAAAPGKPMCIALIGGKLVINIPGSSLAVLYAMEWCVSAAVCRILCKPLPKRPAVQGVLTQSIRASSGMEILCMMDIQRNGDTFEVKQKPRHDAPMSDTLGAGGFYITKLGMGELLPGETAEIALLRGEEDF